MPQSGVKDEVKQRISQYEKGLKFLQKCGTFDLKKFRELNGIIGNMYSEADMERQLEDFKSVIPLHGRRGGPDGLKDLLMDTLNKGISTFSELVNKLS